MTGVKFKNAYKIKMKKLSLGNQSQRENKVFHMPKMRRIRMNKKGDMAHLMISLIMGFMAIAMLTALIPGFVEILDTAQQSDGLNCKGFVYNGNAADSLSYNATIGTKSSIGCLGIKLYLPYLILAVLLGVVMYILYEKSSQGQTPYYGG
jgi:hypothetical protein